MFSSCFCFFGGGCGGGGGDGSHEDGGDGRGDFIYNFMNIATYITTMKCCAHKTCLA